MIVFTNDYDAESLVDIEDDIFFSLNKEFNDKISKVPIDNNGFFKGTFKVTVEWNEDVGNE